MEEAGTDAKSRKASSPQKINLFHQILRLRRYKEEEARREDNLYSSPCLIELSRLPTQSSPPNRQAPAPKDTATAQPNCKYTSNRMRW